MVKNLRSRMSLKKFSIEFTRMSSFFLAMVSVRLHGQLERERHEQDADADFAAELRPYERSATDHEGADDQETPDASYDPAPHGLALDPLALGAELEVVERRA